MRKYHKALVAAALCAGVALSVTGCSDEPLDASKAVATVGEKEMTLGEANFFLRFQQVQTETYYKSMLGDGIYDMDLYGDGTTYGQNLKDDVLSQLHEYYILEEKAAEYGVELTEDQKTKITEAAALFLEENDANAKEQMTADQATVERILTLMTIGTQMVGEIAMDAEITVTEADAAQRGFSYISVSKGSGEEALTDAEIQENKDKLAAAAASALSGNTLDAAAEEQGLTANTGNYGKDNTSAYDEAVIAALDALSEGEVSDVIETETDLYLVQLTAEFDEEATESRMQSLITEQQTEYYNEVMAAWMEEYPLTVEDAVWDEVVFDRSYVVIE